MKIWWNRKYTTIAVYAFLVIAASYLLVMVIGFIPSLFSFGIRLLRVLSSFIIGFAIAYILNPGYMKFREKVYGRMIRKEKYFWIVKTLSLFSIYIIFLGIIVLFFVFITPGIYDSISSLIEWLQKNGVDAYNELIQTIKRLSNGEIVIETNAVQTLTEWLRGFDRTQILSILTTAKDVLVTFFDVFIGIIISAYMLSSKEKLFRQIRAFSRAVFPDVFLKYINELFISVNKTFANYITGVLIESTIVGILCYLAMTLFGIKYALLVAVVVMVTDTIPFFGPFIGGFIAALIVLAGQPNKVVYVVIIITLLQQLDSNFINPKIIGSKTGISGLFVMLAIFIGGGFFGMLGMILAVPVFSVLHEFTARFVRRRLKNLPAENSNKDYP